MVLESGLSWRNQNREKRPLAKRHPHLLSERHTFEAIAAIGADKRYSLDLMPAPWQPTQLALGMPAVGARSHRLPEGHLKALLCPCRREQHCQLCPRAYWTGMPGQKAGWPVATCLPFPSHWSVRPRCRPTRCYGFSSTLNRKSLASVSSDANISHASPDV